MKNRFDFIEIVITDFLEDSVDGGGFAINFQINGPGEAVDYLRVSFTDGFMEDYFKIVWTRDLAKVERKLTHEKRELFIKWALTKIEKWLNGGRKEENLQVDDDEIIWASKVESGQIGPSSEQKQEKTYLFSMPAKP